MIKLKNVSKFYYQDGVVASGITKINLDLNMGEFVVITGASGSGKSTLLNVISGLDTYEEGEMYINGEETSHYTENEYLEYRRKYVSNIFQNFNLVNSYTVYENVMLALLMIGKDRNEVKDYVNDILKKVGLYKQRNTHTSKLSGGQKQRVAIARCLAVNTPVIVADEPTGALDSKASKDILELLHEISKDKLVIVVTHNKEEIEKYATRLIKMNDGKIQEDKEVKKINLDNKNIEYETNLITRKNRIFLGIKNAFNLPVKFVLMFIIFLLISVTLVSNFGDFANSEFTEIDDGYNYYFFDTSNYRIVFNKKDKSIINDNDYNNIKELDNIDYIVKNDLLNDYQLGLTDNYLYLYGNIAKDKINEVDYGRLAVNDNEIVVKGSKNDWYLSDSRDDLLNSTFTIFGLDNTYKIVGIKYLEDESIFSYSNMIFYISDNLKENISLNISQMNTNIDYKINNNTISDKFSNIVINNKIPNNEVWISDNYNYYCENNNCLNNTLKINISNIYNNNYNEYKIGKIFNNISYKEITSGSYDEIMYFVYMNSYEYNKLFPNDTYQSSVFVKDIKNIYKTENELNNLGFNTLVMRDSKVSDTETINQIVRILKLIVTVILVVALFFISYFIIRIIYKSRNSYYTTLRSLGSTKSICVNILMNEMLTIAIFTYLLFLSLIFLIQKEIIKWKYLYDLTRYVTITDYIIVFMILVLLVVLISLRYGKKIFKDSIIKTYGERI